MKPAMDDEFLTVALDLAAQAGEVIKEAFTSRSLKPKTQDAPGTTVIETKGGNDADLVTLTDKYVEHLIFSQLRARFPDHKFIGEESVAAASGSTTKHTALPKEGHVWIVDPID
ncbi:hypothetical protein HK102_005677, partial [Quaeritorhiza haematococci]